MPAKQVKLYGYATSPFVVKVGVFLKYKQIPFDFVPVNPVAPKKQLGKFPGQRQVPVLTIDDEWRADSTPLGIWLDEVFPERPILGEDPSDTDRILAMDQWVNDQLLMGAFRHAAQWDNRWDAIRNGWTLSTILHYSTPLPFFLRKAWPFIIQRVGFVRRFGDSVDQGETLREMRERQRDEFLAHLGNGPYLGNRQRVSLADLSAYSSLMTPHLIGMRPRSTFLDNPVIVDWCRRVQTELPANPLVVPDHLLVRSLP